MTTTYDISNDIGRVRLQTADKDIADAVFTDEEITVFLDAEGSVNLASAALLEAWAAMYGANADSEKIGDYSYTQKIIANLLKMAANLREKESGIPAFTWAELDLAGTSEEAD